jgi:DNA-directed RNA polymerase specialized sigma24 family protein
MKFNSNKDRANYWETLLNKYTGQEIEEALGNLRPESQIVLLLHYGEGISFKMITVLMRISISVVRNHHNRGMFKLYRYFNPAVIENIKLLMSNV